MYTALAGVLLNYFHLVHDTLCFLMIINCYLLPPAEIHQLVYIYFANSAITIRWKITYHSHRLVVSCCSWRIGSIFLLSFFFNSFFFYRDKIVHSRMGCEKLRLFLFLNWLFLLNIYIYIYIYIWTVVSGVNKQFKFIILNKKNRF